MFPLETARTRLAVNHRQYRNVADCLRSMARNEGLGSWYKVQILPIHSLGCAALIIFRVSTCYRMQRAADIIMAFALKSLLILLQL